MMKMPKIIPAGAGEKTQYLAHDFNDNTIRFALSYPGQLKAEVLRTAVAAVVNSVEVLHSSFVPGNLGAYWRVNEDYQEEEFFTLIETEGNPMEEVCKAMLDPVGASDKVQMHCTLVQGREASAIALNISHLCVDGGDGKYLLYKLAEAYRLIAETGSAEGLEVKNGSRAAEQMYEELTPKEVLSLLKSPISDIKTGFPFPAEGEGEKRIVFRQIPAQVIAAARTRAKEAEATVNDLLLTACYRAYVQLPGVDAAEAVGVTSMMDLRRHCREGESEGLCNLSGFFPTALKNGVQGDFAETLEEVSEQTRKMKENPLAGMEGMPLIHTAVHTTPLRLLLAVSEKVYGSLSIGLTNLGNIPCEPLCLDGLFPSEGMFAGPLKKKPAMQVSAASFDGTAVLCCIGEFEEEDCELLLTMLDGMVREVETYASMG